MSLTVEPRRLGGPLGRHARHGGVWFDPAPWAVVAAMVLWMVKLFHQSTCTQTVAGQPVKSMLRMCYSDIPVIWGANQYGLGAATTSDESAIPQTPVVAGFISLARLLAGAIDPSDANSSAQQQLNAGNTFLVVCAVLLFIVFLVWVFSHMLMGRESTRLVARTPDGRLVEPPMRSADAFFIATSLGIFTTGLINFDLIMPALVALALLAWSTGRTATSGVITGVALGAGIAPIILVLVLAVLCLRSGAIQALIRHLIGTLSGVLLALILGAAQSMEATWRAYRALLDPEVGYGSIWWLMREVGIAGGVLPGLSKLAVLAAIGAVGLLALHVDRRPRLAQVGCLMMVGALMLAPTYSPQYVLWLLGWVALARPVWRDWLIFSLTEAIYWAAVWGHLQGNLQFGVGGDLAYPLAIVVRLLGAGWIAWLVVRDMTQPWRDTVRRDGLDDPQGGILDHRRDADWMSIPPGEEGQVQPLPDEIFRKAAQ